MNRHQVITGAANNSESSVAIGSVENNHFTAYGSGGNIVILSSNFDRVQIISSKSISNNSNDILKCIDCTLDTGKIAAAYGNRVYIFEPTPSAKKPSHNIKYKWVKVGLIEFESEIVCISWNNDGSRLLVACERGTIQMWHYNPNSWSVKVSPPTPPPPTKKDSGEIKFSIHDEGIEPTASQSAHSDLNRNDSCLYMFRKIWQTTLSNPVKFLKFSPDGSLFASFGQNDRLVKVWHEMKYISKIISPGDDSQHTPEFSFVYLNHPRAVTSLSWRQISRFMPRGTVSNSLITSCKDNICRIWSETLIPEDGLLHSYQYESTYKSIAKSSSHKRKLLNKLHRMRLHPHFPHLFNTKQSSNSEPKSSPFPGDTNTQLPINSTISINNSQSTLNIAMRQSSAGYTQHNLSPLPSSLHSTNPFNFSTASPSATSQFGPGSLSNSQSCSDISHLKPSSSFVGGGVGANGVNQQYANMHHTSHFHLAGFIDPEAGIPLHLIKTTPGISNISGKTQTSEKSCYSQSQFIVHWMNNKEFHFTNLAELFSKEIYEKIVKIQKGKEDFKGNSQSNENLNQDNKDNSDDDSDGGVNFETRSDVVVIKTKTDNSYDVFENITLDDETKGLLFGNSIDQKLDSFVKDWYSSHDILFCIHPLDGSILIWVVDWLDEFMPNSYRQAQVSFHAKLPNTIPIGDAVSLTNSIFLYTDTEPIRNTSANQTLSNNANRRKSRKSLTTSGMNGDSEDQGVHNFPQPSFFAAGVVYMVSKHSNGTLNLWKLQFQENSKYQSLVNISHMYRVCGHRFRVGHITSHPILPFLLTNSAKWNTADVTEMQHDSKPREIQEIQSSPFCVDLWQRSHKSLIIWGVEPIGPLSKTGGIYELARIDSPKRNAFENIAWFPCFLPSFTLGNSSSSPSTLFASTDADQITIYQAVFDARTLLHDLLTNKTSPQQPIATSPTKVPNSLSFSSTKDIPFDSFNVVSIQSTARPGCIIELEQLPDSGDSGWSKADLFHIYQEGFVVSSISDLNIKSNNSGGEPSEVKFTQFNETYYLVLLEKKRNLSECVHMWKVNIHSSPMMAQASNISETVPTNDTRRSSETRLTITSTRVCQQILPLPDSVYVVCADPAAADLSSSAMFTINKAPYLFTTACSDGVVRFWSCQERANPSVENSENDFSFFEFVEWKLDSTVDGKFVNEMPTKLIDLPSQVRVDSFPLAISCSYNSRFAVAYQKLLNDKDSQYFVKIFECESTGGSKWKCEDTIHFKNIVLPEIDSGINFDYIIGKEKPIKPVMSSHSFKNIVLGSSSSQASGLSSSHQQGIDPTSMTSAYQHQTPEIPSTAAKLSIKKKFLQPSHQEDEVSLHYNKCLIKLDWASTENGSHILTIGLGNKIYVYSCVSKEILGKSSLALTSRDNKNIDDESLVKWLLFRSFELDSADDMQALPTQIKWVRDGLLIIGLDTEMQIYSQWSSLQKNNKKPVDSTTANSETDKSLAHSDVTDNLKNNKKNQISSLVIPKNHSVMDLHKLNKATRNDNKKKSSQHDVMPEDSNDLKAQQNNGTTGVVGVAKRKSSTRFFDETEILEIVQDSGLFMQAKHARPVLPQYHPKQLLELMNSGKINRVKAILMHLTRCIIDFELKRTNKISREKKLKRKLSVCNESEIPEEQSLNYLEVDVIPPLPLFALYAADDDLLSENIMHQRNQSSSLEPEQKIDIMNELKSDPFDTSNMTLLDDNEDELGEDQRQKLLEKKMNEEKAEFKRSILNDTNSMSSGFFSSKVCRLLIDYLSYVQLNGLTSIDQMYLVALADTVTNVKCDVSFGGEDDLFSRKAAFISGSTSDSPPSNSSNQVYNQVVDICGFKFLLALRSYNYLMRTLPLKNRERLKEVGIGTFNFAWAFHSECEHELLDALPFNNSGDQAVVTWTDLRQYGVGWWLKNPQKLKQLIEQVAKCAFQDKMDPLDAALFYLAMRKKGVLGGLFKTVKDVKMAEFFKNDFGQQKWQTAALKNAFVLLGMQRFEHAAAFFLLADRLKDAIEVCIRNLKDLQLAIVIVRLYEIDFENQSQMIKYLLGAEILGYNIEQPMLNKSQTVLANQIDQTRVSTDPFLRSMSYWYLKDYKQALNTLFEVDIGKSDKNRDSSIISHVFNFYTFLKHHPLVLRQQLLESNSVGDEKSNEGLKVTPVERRLHFVTAYYHLINGCPLLALDVLSKLPNYIFSASSAESTKKSFDSNETKKIEKIEKAVDFDWSTPSYNPTSRFEEEKLELDFGMSDGDDDDDVLSKSKGKTHINKSEETKAALNQTKAKELVDLNDLLSSSTKIVDTFAQQLKFISCLKILIEEMSTLANGFEVVGGQLRYYMYYWLERETELLKKLGDYKSVLSKEINAAGDLSALSSLNAVQFTSDDRQSISESDETDSTSDRTSMLHEQVLREQKIFQEKINRVNRRKEWLRSNELLLRTFLSYCSLHGASAAGLNSVKMELVLLMQELVEDRSMKQLLNPLRVQTSIPLLSASIATSKNVVAGPIQMIKSIATDILASIIGINKIPTIFDYSVMIATLKESAISLSSCIYQCLCDSDVSCVQSDSSQVTAGMQGFSRNILYKSSYLISNVRNRMNVSQQRPIKITTSPKNWPGISNLSKLLEREQDTEAPKLKILLFESLVAVYCSLLINAMVFYDCSTLWRLLAKPWDDSMWNRLFGGGCHTESRYKIQANLAIDDENAKQRMRVNNKLGYKLSFSTSPKQFNNTKLAMMSSGFEEKVEIRETFVAPEISMINFFLSDPDIDDDIKIDKAEYDSDEDFTDHKKGSNSREDNYGGENDESSLSFSSDEEDSSRTFKNKQKYEHLNPKSYSWCLIRYAILKLTLSNIGSFLNVIGVETQEIAIQSPLIHQVMKSLEKWSDLLNADLISLFPTGPPTDYITDLITSTPALTTNSLNSFNGPKILKYQSLLDPTKTPFIIGKSTYPVRRLWLLLVTRKSLYDLFIRHIILKSKVDETNAEKSKRTGADSAISNSNSSSYSTSAYKIVHKDQDAIYSFCLNERDKNVMAFCTSKDIIEIDMKSLLQRKNGRDDECEIEISIQGTPRTFYDSEVYVVKEANSAITGNTSAGIGNPASSAHGTGQTADISGHQKAQFVRANDVSVSVLLKRNIKEVRRVSSHPTLPYYLSGTNESVVKLWHWGSSDALSSFKQVEKGSSAKITKLQFNSQGNKFGVSDVDGYLHLYQLLGCSFKAYLTLKCYQIINDFLFIDSSSTLLTIGTSNDSYVVSLWDTLLPSNKSLIKSFKEPDAPSGSCLAYSLLNHLVYCGNRKGEVNIYDIRTHKKLQRLIAHESCVKAITLDPDEYYMATGSNEGNVKLWNSKTLECLQIFHNEHSKSSIIRSLNSGVNQLTFTNQNQILSCGADGTIVIRNLI